MVEARLRTAYIRQQSYSPRPYERKHPLPCLTDVFPEVLILLLQPNQGCQRLLFYSFVVSSFFYSCPPSPIRTSLLLTVNYKRKNVGACFCLFRIRAYHSHSSKQTEKHPRWSILTPVKCASEDMVSPRSTLRRVYTTPRGVTSAMFLSCIRLWKFRSPKTKRQ